MPRDVEVSIRFLKPDEGGRKTPVCNGYRGQFHYAGQKEAWDAPHEYPDSEWVELGQTTRAYLAFLSPERHVEKIQVGTSFEVREGSRLVGVGKVTEIIDLLESAAKSRSRES